MVDVKTENCSVKIIDRDEWEAMLSHSRILQAEAERLCRAGKWAQANTVWEKLSPLNREIRDSLLLRVRGVDPMPHPRSHSA